MPEGTPRELRISDEFVCDLAQVWSEPLRERIRTQLASLQAFPEMGSTDVRPSLTRRYGPGLRKLCISTFVIVYRLTDDAIEVLALVAGPRVR